MAEESHEAGVAVTTFLTIIWRCARRGRWSNGSDVEVLVGRAGRRWPLTGGMNHAVILEKDKGVSAARCNSVQHCAGNTSWASASHEADLLDLTLVTGYVRTDNTNSCCGVNGQRKL